MVLPTEPPPPGYDLLCVLGGGGMGVVYRGRRVADGRDVAIKYPKEADPAAWQRFHRERREIVKFEHPNIVAVLDIFDKPACYVMELCPAGSFRSLPSPCEPREAVRLVLGVARALDYLRTRARVHRDLKPENVLLAEDPAGGPLVPKLADFGLLRRTDGVPMDSLQTSSQELLGTGDYASRQLREAPRTADTRDDVYALGVIFHELLTGRRLPPQREEWGADRLEMGAAAGALEQLCLGCLQDERDRRYFPDQLILALTDYLEGRFPRRPPATLPAFYGEVTFRAGGLVLGVHCPVGGDGRTRYRCADDLPAVCRPDPFQVPEAANRATRDWLRAEALRADKERIVFFDGPQLRLDGWRIGLEDTVEELPRPLTLFTNVTNYFATQMTHFALDAFVTNRRTVRDLLVPEGPEGFPSSQLANPLAVNLSIVTRDGHIAMSRRTRWVGGNRVADPASRVRVPAVSGVADPRHDTTHGPPGGPLFDPFLAAQRETAQEALSHYRFEPGEITFFGLAVTHHTLCPFLFGEARVRLTLDQVQAHIPTQRFEGRLEWRPFTVETVTAWMRELYALDERLAHTGIFSLYQSLIYAFPGRFDEIIDRLSV